MERALRRKANAWQIDRVTLNPVTISRQILTIDIHMQNQTTYADTLAEGKLGGGGVAGPLMFPNIGRSARYKYILIVTAVGFYEVLYKSRSLIPDESHGHT